MDSIGANGGGEFFQPSHDLLSMWGYIRLSDPFFKQLVSS